MVRIGLISDTHGYLDRKVFEHFKDVDEIWHGGDFGSLDLIEELKAFKPLRGVWGNIDEADIRHEFPEVASFTVEGVKVLMMHIGGYPGKYSPKARVQLALLKPQLFISGHSHILKVMYDDKLQCLHMNPGAAGHQGWHQMRTLIRFEIDGANMRNCQVIELGRKGVQ
jgi:putative phosphoesterase